jgi:hypothetical protein
MACVDGSSSGLPDFCLPACRGDFECGGRVCDLSLGVCVDALSGTVPAGAPCDPGAITDPCRGGICVRLQGGGSEGSPGVCSGLCRLGSVGCGEDPGSSGPLASLCLFTDDPSSGTGDLGLCASLCDCDDDCGNPALVCDPLEEQYQVVSSRVGGCTPGTDATGERVPGTPCGSAPGQCGACASHADCDPDLVCARVAIGDFSGYCVPSTGVTECCASGSTCVTVDSALTLGDTQACPPSEGIPLADCADASCVGLCGTELADCSLIACLDELNAIGESCRGCVIAQVGAGACTDAVRAVCASP